MWPGKLSFVKSVLNWLDFLAILPFFIMIITEYLMSTDVAPEDEVAGADAGKGQFVALKVSYLLEL